MSKPNPKLVQSGGDLPWVWGVDGGRGDLTVNEDMKNVTFASGKSTIRSTIGPAVQRSSGPAVQRSSTPRVVCH